MGSPGSGLRRSDTVPVDAARKVVAASGVVVRPGDARGFADLPIFQVFNEFGGHPYVASEIGGNTSVKGDVRRPKQ